MGLLYPIFPACAPSTRLGSYMPSCGRLHGVNEKSLNWILASPRAGCETWRELVEFASHKTELVIPSSQSCCGETEVVGVPRQTRNGRSSVAWRQYLSVRMRGDARLRASDPSRAPSLGVENPRISNAACQGPGRRVVATPSRELRFPKEPTALGWGDLAPGLCFQHPPLLPSPALRKWTCVKRFAHLRHPDATNVRKLRRNRTWQIANTISRGPT